MEPGEHMHCLVLLVFFACAEPPPGSGDALCGESCDGGCAMGLVCLDGVCEDVHPGDAFHPCDATTGET